MLSRIVACTACVLALATPPARSAEQIVNVLIGGARGAYPLLGSALADHIAGTMGVKTQVQETKGSGQSLELLQAGRGEIALAAGDSLFDAAKGREEAGFKTPLDKLRGIAALYPNYIHIIALADSGIRTLADLKGRRVSVGVRNSPIELNARAIFEAAGLSYEDFASVGYFPFGESVELLKDRQIDVILQSAELVTSTLRDLARSVPIVLIPIPAETVGRTGDREYIAAAIPADTYRGQTTDVPTASLQNYLVTREGASTDLVYAITRTLWIGVDQLVAAHASAKAIELKHALDAMPVPLHPGAEKYYREVGLIR